MRYHNITKDDMLNGVGLRSVLWLAGCTHACKGCHNPITWSIDGGLYFDEQAKEELFESISHDYIDGVTLSGGDPLHPQNRKDVEKLLVELKQCYPNKSVWVYTGYEYNDIAELALLDYVDVLVDGLFIEKQLSPNVHWVGSSNQKVIDVQASKKLNQIVLYNS